MWGDADIFSFGPSFLLTPITINSNTKAKMDGQPTIRIGYVPGILSPLITSITTID